MPSSPQPFDISYFGVTTKVTPIVDENYMRYLVRLPTRKVIIETASDENEIGYWVEVPGGRTTLAKEIGAMIERKFM